MKNIFVRDIVIKIGTSFCEISSSDGFYYKTKSRLLFSLITNKRIPKLWDDSYHCHMAKGIKLFSGDVPHNNIDFMINLLLEEMRKQNHFRHRFQKERITLVLPFALTPDAVESVTEKLKSIKVFPKLVTTDLEYYSEQYKYRIYDEIFEKTVRVF
jgi:hypothetical protein